MNIHNISSSQGRVINQAAFESDALETSKKYSSRLALAGLAVCFLFALFQVQTAQAAVAFGSVATATQDDRDIDSISIGLPGGTVADDLLLATIATKKTDKDTGANNVTAPAGWTQVNQGANIDHTALAVFFRIAGASESGPYVFTVDSNVEEIAGAILRYTGVDTSTPIDVSAAQNGKSTSPTSPSVTTTFADTMVVRIFGQKDNNNAVTEPSGTSERVELRDAGDKVTLGGADSTQATIGATGTASFTGTDDEEWRAATVVLIPEQVTLTIDKTTSTPTVDAGNQASFTITVNNTGGATATGVVVSDTLPDGFSFVSTDSGACGTGPSNGATGTVTWSSCTIAASGSLTLNYTVDVAAGTVGGVYTNSASVTSSETSAGPDTVDVTVLDADLSVTKGIDNTYPNEGDTIVYTLTATNSAGSGSATGVEIEDTLPSGVTYVSYNFTSGSGSCSDAGQVVTCTVSGSIAASASVAVQITATVNTGLTPTPSYGDMTLLTNTATVSADQNDPVSGNNSDTADATTCPANHLHNIASVSSGVSDPNEANNSDHICTEVAARDHGDAPASYNDASHTIPASPVILLGATIDADQGAWVDGTDDNGNATDDDDPVGTGSGNGDDEDGVTFFAPSGGGANIIARVEVTNTSGADVTLYGWLDVNANGSFDAGERRSAVISSGGTTTVALAEWIVSSIVSRTYYSRFRVCSTPTECEDPFGHISANDGEVEDYGVSYNPTAVTIGAVDLEAAPVTRFLDGVGVGRMDRAALLALLEAWDPVLSADLAGADAEILLQALREHLDPGGDGQVAVLGWETLEQRGTIGFFVERRQDDGEWILINDDMLPALVPAPMGGEYQLADPQARAGVRYQYRLIEQEADGNTRSYGPYDLEMPE